MANYVVSDTNLAAVANAIRTKGGTSATLSFPDGFVAAIGDIQTGGGGGTDTLAALEANTLTTWTSTATKVKDYLFYGNTALTSVSYPNATAISTSAFERCSGLTSLVFPEVTTISGNAFKDCTGLASVDLPKITQFGQYTFRGCTSLTSVAINPNFTGAGSNYLFYNCTNLEMLDFQKGQNVGSYMFNGCTKFNTLILRFYNPNNQSAIASLSATSAFNNTPFASGKSGGTLYVPEVLIPKYQAANNWSTILGYTNNQIKKIEGSIYE